MLQRSFFKLSVYIFITGASHIMVEVDLAYLMHKLIVSCAVLYYRCLELRPAGTVIDLNVRLLPALGKGLTG